MTQQQADISSLVEDLKPSEKSTKRCFWKGWAVSLKERLSISVSWSIFWKRVWNLSDFRCHLFDVIFGQKSYLMKRQFSCTYKAYYFQYPLCTTIICLFVNLLFIKRTHYFEKTILLRVFLSHFSLNFLKSWWIHSLLFTPKKTVSYFVSLT